MNTNMFSPIMPGAGYYQNSAASLRARTEYTNTNNEVAEGGASRSSPAYSYDTALTEYSSSGDVLELSASSLHQLQSFNSASMPYDLDAMYQQLRANNTPEPLITAFNNIRNAIEFRENAIAGFENTILQQEASIEGFHNQIEALAEILLEMERNIQAQENATDLIEEQRGAVEELISNEQDRLDVIADNLEDRLGRQEERLEDRIENAIDRRLTNIDRRLARIERMVSRFDARMVRRNENEMNRRALVEERISQMVPGSPEYIRAREAEARRQERFYTTNERLTARHERRLDRAEARFERWYDRSQGRIDNMRNNLNRQVEANELRVETTRTTSARMTNLTRQYEELEVLQANSESIVEDLQALFDRTEQEQEREIELLEGSIATVTDALGTSHATLAQHRAGLEREQTNMSNLIANLRTMGHLS